MTHKEIEKYRQELTNILKEEDKKVRLDKLEELAKKVGASTTRWVTTEYYENGRVNRTVESNEITETEIVNNIQIALQTASMIDACKASAENYKIAIKASKTAFWSMIAAWAAVVFGALIAVFK